jgi:hypothetical protein
MLLLPMRGPRTLRALITSSVSAAIAPALPTHAPAGHRRDLRLHQHSRGHGVGSCRGVSVCFGATACGGADLTTTAKFLFGRDFDGLTFGHLYTA